MKKENSIYLTQKEIQKNYESKRISLEELENLISIWNITKSKGKVNLSIQEAILFLEKIKNFKKIYSLNSDLEVVKSFLKEQVLIHIESEKDSSSLPLEEVIARLKFVQKLFPKKSEMVVPPKEKEGKIKISFVDKSEKLDLKEGLGLIILGKLTLANIPDEDLFHKIYSLKELVPAGSELEENLSLKISLLREKMEEDKRRAEVEAKKKAEEKRIQYLKDNPKEMPPPCPFCGYLYSIKQEQRQGNGIIGPGYHSRVLMSWYECKNPQCKQSHSMKNH